MKIRKNAIACMLIFLGVPCLAQSDKIVGIYEVTEPDTGELSKVEIYKTGNTYNAKVIWLAEPCFPDGTLKKDLKNPDPALRETPADQIMLVTELRYNADKDMWEKGRIYHPVHGKYYRVQVKFDDEKTLNVRGYVGVPAMGMTVYWKKIS